MYHSGATEDEWTAGHDDKYGPAPPSRRSQPRRALVSILQRNVAKLREILREKDDLIARLARTDPAHAGGSAGAVLEMDSALVIAQQESTRLRRDLLETQRRLEEATRVQATLRTQCAQALTSAEAMVTEVMTSSSKATACEAQAAKDVELIRAVIAPVPVLGDVVLVEPADASQVSDAVSGVTGRIDPIAFGLGSRVALIVNELNTGFSVQYLAGGGREHRLPGSRLRVLFRHIGDDADKQLNAIAAAAERVSGTHARGGPGAGGEAIRSLRTAGSNAALKRVLTGTTAALRMNSSRSMSQRSPSPDASTSGGKPSNGGDSIRTLAKKAASFRVGTTLSTTTPGAGDALKTWDAGAASFRSTSAGATLSGSSLLAAQHAFELVSNGHGTSSSRQVSSHEVQDHLQGRPTVRVRPIGSSAAFAASSHPGVASGALPQLLAPSASGAGASFRRPMSASRAQSAGRTRTALDPLPESSVCVPGGGGEWERPARRDVSAPPAHGVDVRASGEPTVTPRAGMQASSPRSRAGAYVPSATSALLQAYLDVRQENVALQHRVAQLEAENFALREGAILEAHKHARSGAFDSDRMRTAATRTGFPSPAGSLDALPHTTSNSDARVTVPGLAIKPLPRVPSSMKAVMTGRSRADTGADNQLVDEIIVEDDDSGSGWDEDDVHATKVA